MSNLRGKVKIEIWIKDRLVWEEEVTEEEAEDMKKNIEVMISKDGKIWNYI